MAMVRVMAVARAMVLVVEEDILDLWHIHVPNILCPVDRLGDPHVLCHLS